MRTVPWLQLGVTVLAFSVDRVVKVLIRLTTENYSGISAAFGYSENHRAALSMPLAGNVLIMAGVLALLGVAYLGERAVRHGHVVHAWGAAFMFAGGWSNLWDRLTVGGVVDVFHLTSVGLSFNLADLYLVAGLGVFAFSRVNR